MLVMVTDADGAVTLATEPEYGRVRNEANPARQLDISAADNHELLPRGVLFRDCESRSQCC